MEYTHSLLVSLRNDSGMNDVIGCLEVAASEEEHPLVTAHDVARAIDIESNGVMLRDGDRLEVSIQLTKRLQAGTG